MTDGPERPRQERPQARGKPVESLASQALSMLASRRGSKSILLDANLAHKLREAVLSSDPSARDAVIGEFREAGIPDETIVDQYIPFAARQLGEDWCNDDISFAQTSIGSSRLQSLLRDLTPGGPRDAETFGDGAGVAVIVLAEDNHTLGAMILTHQLRRMGISVRVMVGADDEDTLQSIGSDRFDALFISASRAESLGNLKKFVETARRQTKQNIPVVIGGRVTELVDDVTAESGADFATSDAEEAVRLCGLIAPVRAFAKRTR